MRERLVPYLSTLSSAPRVLALVGLLCACGATRHAPANEPDASRPQDAGSADAEDASTSAVRRAPSGVDASTDAAASPQEPPDAEAMDAAISGRQAPVEVQRQLFELVRTRGWPGDGAQLTFAPAPGRLGSPEQSAPRVLREDGSELSFQRSAVGEPSGITALLIVPAADPLEHAAQLEAVRALVAELPPGERIGIWLGSGVLPLVCELTERRDHLLDRLASIAPQDATAVPIEPTSLAALGQRLNKVSGPHATTARTLIFVGATDVLDVSAEQPRMLRLGALDQSAVDAFGWQDRSSATAAGKELGATLVRSRELSFRLGFCDVAAGERIQVELGEQRFELTVPAERSVVPERCDAKAAAQDAYPFPNAVHFVMDETQLAEHDRLAAEVSGSDFTFQLAFGDGTALPAYGNFRGKTSLECERKSYDVHFTDGAARRLMGHAHADEFLLISMCWDNGWFRQVLANRIMRKLGLFPLEQHYVKLRVGDRERGVYLMLEKPDVALRKHQSNLAALIRRRADHDGAPPESTYPKYYRDPELAKQAVSEYEAVVALVSSVEPSALSDALSARLDLDGYLRWLAVMTFFQNGDYVDEVFFYASDEAGAWYFRNFGWDCDDLFAPCHGAGEHAMADPHELLYCLEGNLDRALFVAPDIYARFVELLRGLMADELATDRVLETLAEVHAELAGLFVDDAVCAGTGLVVDGELASCAKLQTWLGALVQEFEMQVRARADVLQERARAYGVTP